MYDPYIMIAVNWIRQHLRKDTSCNIEETGEFVWNIATYDYRKETAAHVKWDEEAYPGTQ